MKRIPADPFPITTIKPFFWKLCDCCKQEFRREPGWWLRIPGANHHVFDKYLCAECAPDFAAAQAHRKKYTEPIPRHLRNANIRRSP